MAIPIRARVQTAVDLVPLCVDLDGTLVRTDTLAESVLDVARQRPLALLQLPAALWRGGRPGLKHAVAEAAPFEPDSLPFREELIEELRLLHAFGRRLVLATAAHESIARAVAEELGIFDEVIASTDSCNLKGAAKRDALNARYGAGNYDYVGDSTADMPVWKAARRAWVIGDERLAGQLRRDGVEVERFVPGGGRSPLAAWVQALRPYQWCKNLLVYLPMLMGHSFFDWTRWLEATIAFVALSMLASAGYLINDLFDRRHDRRHERKRRRPFASGELPLHWAATIPVLVIEAFGLGALLGSARSIEILALYFVCTLSYSAWLKNRSVIDVILLSCLYSVRIALGGYATRTEISVWLISFSVFIFFTLALVKRAAELRHWELAGRREAPGRGYAVADLPMISNMGVSAGYLSALVLALYIQSPEIAARYGHSKVLWLVLPVLLAWLSHVWLKTHRGEMTDDPIVFALRDRLSLLLGAAVGVIAACAL